MAAKRLTHIPDLDPPATSYPLIERARQLPRPLYLFLLLSAVLTCAAFLFSQISRALHLGLPYAFPYYFVPMDLGSDLRYFWTKFNQYPHWIFYTGEAGYFLYPLPLFYIIGAFFRTSHPFVIFPIVVLLLTGILVYCFVRGMRAAGMVSGALVTFVAGVTLLSYPLAFEYLRLNIEILLFSLTAIGILFWWRNQPYWAAFFFGLATACKMYPFMLLGLFFAERKWRPFFFGIATALLVLLASYAAFGPTIHDAFAWNTFNLSLFQTRYAGLRTQLGYDHSFFALVKFATVPWDTPLSRWVPIYVRTAAISAVILYFVRIWKMPRLNQVTILSVLSITLPPVSFDYTLLAVYPPLILLCMQICRQYRKGEPFYPGITSLMVLYALVLTPLSFVVIADYRYAGQLRCLCLILLLWKVLRTPMPTSNDPAILRMGQEHRLEVPSAA